MFDKLTQLLAARAGQMGQKPGTGMGGHTAQGPGMGVPSPEAGAGITQPGMGMPQIRPDGFIGNLFAKFGKSAGGGGWTPGMGSKSPQLGMAKPHVMQGAPMGMSAPPISPSAPPPAAPEAPMPEPGMADAPTSEPPMRMFDNRRNRVRM